MAKSQLAKEMTKLGGKNVNDSDIYDSVVSDMRDPNDLAQYRAGLDFRPYGSELASNESLLNDYMQSLVKQYGVIFQKVALAQNPLSMFKKGVMPIGGKIESVVYDIVEPKLYSPFYRDRLGNAQSPFEQSFNEPLGKTYTEKQDITSPTTIIDSVDTEYFQNLDQFHGYIYNKIIALVNGAINDEYRLTKLTLSEPIADNVMPSYNIKKRATSAETSKELAKSILKTARKMRYFTRNYNGAGVAQASVVDDIVVIMNLDYSVDIDMDYLGQLFNAENGQDFNIEKIEVDGFPSIWKYSQDHKVELDDYNTGDLSVRGYNLEIDKPLAITNNYGTWYLDEIVPKGHLAMAGAKDAVQVLDGSTVAAVILDRDALQIWDQLPMRLSLVSNPRGRYQNVLLNKKSLFAYIEGLNAMAITVSDQEDGKIKYPTIIPDDHNTSNGSGGSDTSGGSSSGSNTSSK